MEATALVKTIGERCRVCYTCVRECPAKAIRIAGGQAQVIAERCIGCGNCVRVCSQKAKQVLDSTEAVSALLASPAATAAIVAPSFPAEFTEVGWRRVVGAIRKLGFDAVHEVAFGADLVARGYRELLKRGGRSYIATSCPAIVAYVERYAPDLVGSLAPIVSPMIASARALRELADGELKIVFVGPCISKKGEAADDALGGEIDAVLTFVELRDMFARAGVELASSEEADFDPPHAGTGALFPVSRGLLQAADITEDIITDEVVAADGGSGFVEAIRDFGAGQMGARLLEVLACNGCIMGPGVSNDVPLFGRRRLIGAYVRDKMRTFDRGAWEASMGRFARLDLTRTYREQDQRIPVPFDEEIRHILMRSGKRTPDDELNCGACGYATCRDHAIAIFKGLAETEMCLPHTIEQLHNAVGDLARSHEQLATTQEALMQSEKLASMGQLAAGIAHEVNNPLGVVLMYAHLLMEQAEVAPPLKGDLKMIAEQADRCKKIVAGLLNFARQTKVLRQPTNLVELIASAVRAVRVGEGVSVETRHDLDDPVIELDRDQMAQVLINLLTNALAAMEGGGTLTVSTSADDEQVRIAVADTGVGIPPANIKKIFEPFFTTKQMGKGTGLGLAVTYGIIKMHNGDISVRSNADPARGQTGSVFTVTLPRGGQRDVSLSG
jgi:signal transduction histidine kinase/NAD-dependent dihydropyrimidine dehydrogenase PreA subunit